MLTLTDKQKADIAPAIVAYGFIVVGVVATLIAALSSR